MAIEKITIGDIEADVEQKEIRNVHLSVHPPNGHVTIAAPNGMKLDTVRVFALSKLDWIRAQQRKIREQERETPRDFNERESHYVWGTRYLMSVREREAPPQIELVGETLRLTVRPGTGEEKRGRILAEWYRDELKREIPPLITKWEPIMGVEVADFAVRKMKTKWGSCSPERGTIRLNLELAKKPKSCLEYLVVHEMTHLLEPTHNARFLALMDQFLPRWELRREELNRLPVRHEHWKY